MYIQEWEAQVGKGYSNEPELTLVISGLCPVCQQVDRYSSSALEVTERLVTTGDKEILAWAIGRATDKFVCNNCGVASIVPPRQAELFQEIVEQTLTPRWFDYAISQLGCEVVERTASGPDDYSYTYRGYRFSDVSGTYRDAFGFDGG